MHWIDDNTALPPTRLALGPDSEAPGLLAAGGRVTPARLLQAYSQGIFPWYSAGQPVLWWAPDPRMVLPVAQFHMAQSLKKTLRRFLRTPGCTVRFDSQFATVMQACATTPRGDQDGTWILQAMVDAYTQGHEAGFVHCVETYIDGALAGGLYFVNLGQMVYGESMFAWRTDASKIALAALVAACRVRGVALIDCQQNTGHLARFGAHEVPRSHFEAHLSQTVHTAPVAQWSYDEDAWGPLLEGRNPSDHPPAQPPHFFPA